jgi:hypothetical protein
MPAFSIYYIYPTYLQVVLSVRNLRKRRAVVIRSHLTLSGQVVPTSTAVFPTSALLFLTMNSDDFPKQLSQIFFNGKGVCGYLLWSRKECSCYLNNIRSQNANICQYFNTKQFISLQCRLIAQYLTLEDLDCELLHVLNTLKDNARSVGLIPPLYSNSASHCYVCVRSYYHWTTIHLKVTSGVIMTHTCIASHLGDTDQHRYWLHQM